MIDQQYQGKGYAKRFLRLLIQFLQNKFECKTIYLSLHPDNKLAMGLYRVIWLPFKMAILMMKALL